MASNPNPSAQIHTSAPESINCQSSAETALLKKIQVKVAAQIVLNTESPASSSTTTNKSKTPTATQTPITNTGCRISNHLFSYND